MAADSEAGLTCGIFILVPELRRPHSTGCILLEEGLHLLVEVRRLDIGERLVGDVLVALGEEPGQLVADPRPHPHPQGAPAEILGRFEPAVAADQVAIGRDGDGLEQADALHGVHEWRQVASVAAVAFADDDGGDGAVEFDVPAFRHGSHLALSKGPGPPLDHVGESVIVEEVAQVVTRAEP